MVATAIPQPMPNETQVQYAIRSHEALMNVIPNTDERNRAVFLAWQNAHTNEQKRFESIIASKLPDSRYKRESFVESPALFAEHEYRDRQGQPEQYTRDDLALIVQRCNHRILDTANFAALSDGHSPMPHEKQRGEKEPDLLGYVGPFYLGMVGNENPRWAIYADEYHIRETQDVAKMRPGRSVELWLHPNMGDRFFDPIAALGVTTPKLDLGLRFHKQGEHTVVKYSAYAAFAGASNTHVPEATKAPKQRFEGDEESEPANNANGGIFMDSPDDLKSKLTEAIAQAIEASFAGVSAPAPPQPGGAPTPQAPDTSMYEGEEDDDEEELYEGEEEDVVNGVATDGSEEKELFSKRRRGPKRAGRSDVNVAKYQREVETLKASHASMRRQKDNLEKKVKALEADSVNAVRHSTLKDCYSRLAMQDVRKEINGESVQVPGHVHQMEYCQYSKMSDRDFASHIEMLETTLPERSEENNLSIAYGATQFPAYVSQAQYSKSREGQEALAGNNTAFNQRVRAEVEARRRAGTFTSYKDVKRDLYSKEFGDVERVRA